MSDERSDCIYRKEGIQIKKDCEKGYLNCELAMICCAYKKKSMADGNCGPEQEMVDEKAKEFKLDISKLEPDEHSKAAKKIENDLIKEQRLAKKRQEQMVRDVHQPGLVDRLNVK
jgi:hypothetical protein